MFNPDTPAKCCSYCGGRDHDFEECPKRKADAEKEAAQRPQSSGRKLFVELTAAPFSLFAARYINAEAARLLSHPAASA
ncbi:hypothetical protein [Mesorhizobium sp. B2-7-1]|uniref:hypothetical protein n=1 Tax=Mesorhizobium sp. B2-7-1 TaxID=2589909 RepID=UPI0015E3A9B5|nr:hypothetical protein [Mesorhizobium sp. B2-7-1]